MQLAQAIGSYLLRLYPNHRWAVNVEITQNMAVIFNMDVSTEWGYRLMKCDWLNMRQMERRIRHAGGEILERGRLLIGAADVDQIAEATRDHRGNIITER